MILLRLVKKDKDADQEFLVEVIRHREIFKDVLMTDKKRSN